MAWTTTGSILINVAIKEPIAGALNRHLKHGYQRAEGIEGLAYLLHAIASGSMDGRVFAVQQTQPPYSSGVRATGAFSCDTYGSVAAGDTFTLGQAVVTVVAAGTATKSYECDIGTTADTFVANLASAFNRHPLTRGMVTCAEDTGDDDVDVTAVDWGVHGNTIYIATDSDGCSTSASNLTGGTAGQGSSEGVEYLEQARVYFNGAAGATP